MTQEQKFRVDYISAECPRCGRAITRLSKSTDVPRFKHHKCQHGWHCEGVGSDPLEPRCPQCRADRHPEQKAKD